MTYFVDYALKAGATVVPIRAVGHQDNMVIVDNSDAGYSVIQGTFLNSTATPYWSDNNGSDASISLSPTAPAIEPGDRDRANSLRTFPRAAYPVYTWYNTATNRSTSAAYTINYAGGSFTVHVNQQLYRQWMDLPRHLLLQRRDVGECANLERIEFHRPGHR